jgi:hypothetical protein
MPSRFTDSAAKAAHSGTQGSSASVWFPANRCELRLTNQLLEASCSAVSRSSSWGSLFCAPQGLESSAQGFNPGSRPPKRRALKGRQTERPNHAEAGPDGTSQLRTLTFCGGNASFIWYPHLSPLQGEPFIFEGSQG